jgi:hypothetical protein
MTETEAIQWLEDRIPPGSEPILDDEAYDRTLAVWVVTADEEYRLNRAAADLCRQKASASAEFHGDGINATQEQQIFDHWMRLSEEFDQLAALEETVTTDSSSMLRTRSVSNQPVW